MKWLQHYPFRRQLTLALLISSLLVTLSTSIALYQIAYRQFREMSIQLTQNSIGVVRSSIDSYFETIETSTTEVLMSTSLRNLVESPNSTTADATYALLNPLDVDVNNMIRVASMYSVNLEQVDIYCANGYEYSSRQSRLFDSYEDCLNTLASYGIDTGDHYVRTQWSLLPSSRSTKEYISCIRYIYDSRMMRIGVMITTLNPNELNHLLVSLPDAKIISSTGTILARQNTNSVDSAITNQPLLDAIDKKPSGDTLVQHENGVEKIVFYSPVGSIATYLVVPNQIFESMLERQTTEYKNTVLLITAITILCVAVIAFIISRNMSRNMHRLTDFIRNVDNKPNTSQRYPVAGNNEYDQIGNKLNDMLDTIQQTAIQREEELKINQTLELSLLRAQLNPHLLYNTLNSVLLNLETHQDDNATQLIMSLSGYFQHSLSAGKQSIPISDELQLVQYYLDLQQRARHKSIQLNLRIPDEVCAVTVPKLTLQPLVENAVVHGFEGYRDDGTITISSHADEEHLYICVEDNGIGMPEEEKSRINQMLLAQPDSTEVESYGLYGIHRILQKTYGSHSGLRIDSEYGCYTRVTVILPLP